MSFTIKDCLPAPEQWMSLRESVGWSVFQEEVAQKSLDATLYCVCAFENGDLVGMARVLGDGVISFYIGNVIVRPDKQNQGIGKAILERIIAYVEGAAYPGAIASLFAIQGKEAFYTRFGFECRPDECHGSGMSRYF